MKKKVNLSLRLGLLFLFFGSLGTGALAQPYTFTHLAGSLGGSGLEDGTGSDARFNDPSGVAVDGSGNIYVADTYNHAIRKITSGGVVSTLAGLAGSPGSNDGIGSDARFKCPNSVAVDGAGNVYAADTENHTIRKISTTGVVTTRAGLAGAWGSSDGAGSDARFAYPSSVAADGAGNVYVADKLNHTIRKITSGGIVTTLAGLAGQSGSADGTGSAARFNIPSGVAVDGAGNVYVADTYNNTIRKITSAGIVTTLAGLAGSNGSIDGTGSDARFFSPRGVAADGNGNVYVADGESTIRMITSGGIVTTVAGVASVAGSSDGSASAARFYSPGGVAVDGDGSLYIADTRNNTIRKMTAVGGVTTLAGLAASFGNSDGSGSAARFHLPSGAAIDAIGNVFVADQHNNTIRKITSGGDVTTIAGLAGQYGSADGNGGAARFNAPSAVALDGGGNLYIADTNNHTIRKLTSSGDVSTLAGFPGLSGGTDGVADAARFYKPSGIAVDGSGSIYVADTVNSTIRIITNGGVVTTLAGLSGASGTVDGTGSSARFHYPSGVAVDNTGNAYVADTQNNTIRKITSGGVVTTFAGLGGISGTTDGTGSDARFNNPLAIAVDGSGALFVADKTTIRRITAGGAVSTVAGGATGSSDGTGSVARFTYPAGVVVDSVGTAYVADTYNNAIRVGSPAIADVATIDAASALVGAARQLDTAPQSATGWQWSIIRQPSNSLAQLSSTSARNPTFTPDVADLYVFRLVANSASGTSITTVSLKAAPPPPSITSILPSSGPSAGGQSVVISGTHLLGGSVTIGGNVASVTDSNETSLTFTAPPHAAGAVDVTVTTSGGAATSTNGYTYVPTPTITSISPNAGPTAGGQAVVVNGTNLSGATVTIGGVSATVTDTTSTAVALTTPPHPAGAVDVTVTTQVGSVTSPAGYTYAAPPTIADISPNSGTTVGGQTVVITGTNLSGAAVAIDGIAATVANTTSTTATFTTPSHAAGAVGLTVTTAGGSATSVGGYTYVEPPPNSDRYFFTHLAGNFVGPGMEDGTGSEARFAGPWGVAADGAGNVYVADTLNCTIRKVSLTGVVTTIAGLAGAPGSSDGTGSGARFNRPRGIAVASDGSMYVADTGNRTIRKISSAGVVTTLAGLAGSWGSTDGTGSSARFSEAFGVAVDDAGTVYVADTYNSTIRKITSGGAVTTLAGLAGSSGTSDGLGSAARFYNPWGVAVDAGGNLYVVDTNNATIRKITSGGEVTTLAGLAGAFGSIDGIGTAARFAGPEGIAADSAGNVYVADTANTIRKITSDGTVTTLAGLAGEFGSNDGTGSAARFFNPMGVAADSAGNVYVADTGGNIIRKINSGAAVTTLAGLAGYSGSNDDVEGAARFDRPSGIAVGSAGNAFVADRFNNTIRRISSAGVVTTLAGMAGSWGSFDGTGSNARFSSPKGIAVDGADNIYVADTGAHTIRKINSDGVVTTFAGLAGSTGGSDGPGGNARFNTPSGVAVDDAGNVYVADTFNYTVRKISSSGVVATLAGLAGSPGSGDGTGSAARFYYPTGVAVDGGGTVYVADTSNQTIRKISTGGVVTTLAGLTGQFGNVDGTGSTARFSNPEGVATDALGNVYVADTGNHLLRRITAGGVVTTVGGLAGALGNCDGTESVARFYRPSGIALDSVGRIFIADTDNHAIRTGAPAIPDVATIDAASGSTAVSRQLDTAPQSATSWRWSVIRRPSGSVAQLSSTSVRNPTFTPDAADLYIFRLTATSPLGTSITTVSLNAVSVANSDANGDGTIDAADIVYLIHYLVSGGPLPVGSGDSNGDGKVNMSDVFFLINYLFLGGPPPV